MITKSILVPWAPPGGSLGGPWRPPGGSLEASWKLVQKITLKKGPLVCLLGSLFAHSGHCDSSASNHACIHFKYREGLSPNCRLVFWVMPGSFRSDSMNLGLKLLVIQDRTLANFMSGRCSENGPIRLILITVWCPGSRLETLRKVPGGTWRPFEGWFIK